MRSFHWRWTALILGVVTLLAGCASLPDVSAFPEQANRLASEVNAGYTLSQASVETVSSTQGQALTTAWEPTATTLSAVVAYSQAVASLAEQGNTGAEAGQALATALEGVSMSLGVGSIPNAVSPVISTINEQIARVRARNALCDAIAEAQLPVDAVAGLVSDQLKDLATVHARAVRQTRIEHRGAHQEMVDYVEATQRAEARILRILRRILDYQEAAGGASAEDLRAIQELDPKARVDNLEAREAHWVGMVKRHQEHLAPYASRYAAFETRDASLQASLRDGGLTFRRAQAAVRAWAGAHAQLGHALADGGSFQPTEFVRAIGEIHRAVARAEMVAAE